MRVCLRALPADHTERTAAPTESRTDSVGGPRPCLLEHSPQGSPQTGLPTEPCLHVCFSVDWCASAAPPPRLARYIPSVVTVRRRRSTRSPGRAGAQGAAEGSPPLTASTQPWQPNSRTLDLGFPRRHLFCEQVHDLHTLHTLRDAISIQSDDAIRTLANLGDPDGMELDGMELDGMELDGMELDGWSW